MRRIMNSPLSDHLTVLARLELRIKKQALKRNIQIRDPNPANIKMFSEELGAVNWESSPSLIRWVKSST